MTPVQLRAARAMLQLSLMRVSNLTGIAYQTIHLAENGLSKPYPRTIKKLERFYTSRGIMLVPGGCILLKDVEKMA